jgi:hypothetical protein
LRLETRCYGAGGFYRHNNISDILVWYVKEDGRDPKIIPAVMQQKIYPGLVHILEITHPEFDPVGNVLDVARDDLYFTAWHQVYDMQIDRTSHLY